MGITGIFSGGYRFTPQWTRYCSRRASPAALLKRAEFYMTPTYGNTLMGLACSRPVTAAEGYKIATTLRNLGH